MLLLFIYSHDSQSIGRPNKDLLPQESQMELFVTKMNMQKLLLDEAGCLLPLSKWTGVELDEDGIIYAIRWGFDDSICAHPAYSCGIDYTVADLEWKKGGEVDFQWLPRSIKSLCIHFLDLGGSVETHSLPRLLQNLDLTRNVLEGEFQTPGLPREMQNINISHNRLSGSLDLTALPEALFTFYASWNNFSGSIHFQCLPDDIQVLALDNNKFSGALHLQSLPSSLNQLTLNGNSRLGQDILVVDRDGKRNLDIRVETGKFHNICDTYGRSILVEDLHENQTRIQILNHD